MTKKEFLNSISKDEEDFIQQLLDLLKKMEIEYCVIGGLGVNAYVEPVVSLDLDIVVTTDSIDELTKQASKSFKVEKFTHSYNLSKPNSDLRIQLQTDPRYQGFIHNASLKDVMGYEMKVAPIEDILKGKIWAYSDEQRRGSKRQKDLADIFRIIESYPNLKIELPESIKSKLD